MSRRPSNIKINEKNYKVISRSKSWGASRDAAGQITYHKQLIEITKGQNPSDYLDTVIHEVMHGIIEEYGVSMDRRREEKFVTQISNNLTDVLKKNPKLLEWIIKQAQKSE